MSRGRRQKKELNGMDAGTPEMARHFNLVPRLSDPTTLTMKIMNGDEIDRLLLNDSIDPNQHGTLTTLARKLQGYGYSGIRSPDYSSPPTHLDPELVADKKALAIRGAVSIISKMDAHPSIGAYRRKKLLHLVLDGGPWGNLRHQIEDLHAAVLGLDDIFLNRR